MGAPPPSAAAQAGRAAHLEAVRRGPHAQGVVMASQQVKLTKAETVAALLKEYEVCQASASSLEQVIWQTSAVLGLGSLGAIIAVAAKTPPFLVSAVIAALSTAASFLWWQVANRWWTIEHIKFARMRHIERHLGVLRQNNYIKYVDDLYDSLHPRQPSPTPINERAIRSKLRTTLRLGDAEADEIELLDYQRAGPKEILQSLRWIILASWIVYLLAYLVHPTIQFITHWWPHLYFWILPGA